jgi:hypothetical protein
MNAPHLDDVDSFLQAPHDVWHFNVERDKALRRGVTVDAVNRTLEAAIGGQLLGDVKARSLVEPHMIRLRLPMAVRSDIQRLLLLPVPTVGGGLVPLSELGEFVRMPQDEPVFHKNLRPVEFVTAETVGRLAAPIYGMLEVEQQLENYRLPGGGMLESFWIGPPPNDGSVAFEWAGEWTVTYETFRDMGIAFAIALVLIYMLVVWEFGNFLLPAIVMAPIPLTLIGIIPGHWILGAEFTATSMIGFIALAGIIVRNSILLVDFARHQVAHGEDLMQAMINACQARTRPILITAFALLAGSSVILFDPIFQGMAVSLMFGTIVATLLTLLVIPLGCISARKTFESLDRHEPEPTGDGTLAAMGPGDTVTPAPDHGAAAAPRKMTDPSGGPLANALGLILLYLKSLALSFVEGVVQMLRAIARLILRLVGGGPGGSGGPDGGGPGAGTQGPGGAPPSAGPDAGPAPPRSPETRGDRAAPGRDRTPGGGRAAAPSPGGKAIEPEKAGPGPDTAQADERAEPPTEVPGDASPSTTPASAPPSGGEGVPEEPGPKGKATADEPKTPVAASPAPSVQKAGTAHREPDSASSPVEKSAGSGAAASNVRRRRGIRLR